MIVKRLFFIGLLVGLTVGISGVGMAEKMDIPTHNLVIEKLERVIAQMSPKDPTRVGIVARLGDLYAEKSRLKELIEGKKNCKNCEGSETDRLKALAYYEQIFDKVDIDKKEFVLMQMGHLYMVVGQPQKAINLYERILREGVKNSSTRLVSRSHTGLGDVFFSRGKFQDALYHYNMALRFPNVARKGYVMHRKSWCHLNIGQTDKATKTIISVLESPELLASETSDGKKIDQAFHRDVSADLATFLARGEVSQSEINMLIQLSPDDFAKENTHYLGEETDRLGKKQSSLLVWLNYLKFPTTPVERLEVQIRVAQLRYDLGETERAVVELEKATEMWKRQGCPDENACGLLKLRIRTFVTTWNKAEKNKPTAELLKAYVAYTNLFDNDSEMLYWGALVARTLQSWPRAIVFYHNGSIQAKREFLAAKDDEAKKKFDKIFNGSLLGEIEVAEITKNPEVRLNAYNHYLKINPNGSKELDVRYQKANVYYDLKDYKKSAELYTVVALMKKPDGEELSKKAADLALDSLVFVKRDDLIEKWALEFAQRFPTHRVEYLKIARKSVIAQTATVIESKSADTEDFKRALKKLTSVDLAGSTPAEQKVLFKNMITLAEKSQNISQIEVGAANLMKVNPISEQDFEYAQDRLVFAAEMQLDFSKAFRIAKQMKFTGMKEDQKFLRLAFLAELANVDAEVYYRNYLRVAGDINQANEIRARRVRQSAQPWAALAAQLGALRKTPAILGPLVLEVFARDKNINNARQILNSGAIGRHPAAGTVNRVVFLYDFNKLNEGILNHKIVTSSNSLTQNTLKERLGLLADVEQAAAKAIQMRDWTLQLVTLSALERENKRLYDSLTDLPLPVGLTPQQQAEYKTMLIQKAKPYAMKGREYEQKVNSFWNNSDAIDSLVKDYRNSSVAVAEMYETEIRNLASIAPDSIRGRLISAVSRTLDRPSRTEVLAAREKVRANPFNLDAVKDLRDIEERFGSDTMVAYLDSRIKLMGRN